jgi:NAD(P)-dependent dehydrogenase (short-subunit alcohol dehydrogenase family)
MRCLRGKIALVTGAARGIGAAIAERMEREGATVVRADVSPFGDDVRNRPTVRLDVSDSAQWQAAASMIERDHGVLDILVNNAGVAPPILFKDLTFDQWRKVIAVNLNGAFFGCHTLLPLMIAAAGRSGQSASIVNMASVAAAIGMTHNSAYGASKGGLVALTKHLAIEFGRTGVNIRVNAILPDATDTESMKQTVRTMSGSTEGADSEILTMAATGNPSGMVGRVEDIARRVGKQAGSLREEEWRGKPKWRGRERRDASFMGRTSWPRTAQSTQMGASAWRGRTSPCGCWSDPGWPCGYAASPSALRRRTVLFQYGGPRLGERVRIAPEGRVHELKRGRLGHSPSPGRRRHGHPPRSGL